MLKLTIVAAFVVLGGSASWACSGPGALRTIRESELIGLGFAAVAVGVVLVGCKLVRRYVPSRRVRWVVLPLVLHPWFWMSALRGDCGYGLRYWAPIGTVEIALVVGLALCWPRPGEAVPRKWRWTLSGAIAGLLAGIPIAAVLASEGPFVLPTVNLLIAGAIVWSTAMGGALIGGGLFHWRTERERRFRFRLRTLIVLPTVVAPVLLVLLREAPYEFSVPLPLHFVVVDAATGRPVAGATIQLVELAHTSDNIVAHFTPVVMRADGSQVASIVTVADGSAEGFVHVNGQGRSGLLGRTETIDYHSLLIQVKAPGYRPFRTSLASASPPGREPLTAPPLGLPYPPPARVTIRLSPNADADPR